MECDVAIVGAGLAGISAAKTLLASQLKVVVLDKARGVGGRAATRRFDGIPTDHGAQFFTARTEVFQSKIGEWKDAGVCREWTCGFPVWKGGGLHYLPDGHPRYCCPAGMTSLAKYESREFEVLREQKVTSVEAVSEGVRLVTASGLEIRARMAISTAPAPQTLALFKDLIAGETRSTLQSISYAPCITAIFKAPGFTPDWVAMTIEGEDASWIASDGSKRDYAGRPGPFVVHGSVAFSREHLEEDPADAAVHLLRTAARITHGGLAGAELLHAHRWRFAMVENPLPEVFLQLSDTPGLFFAGDAFLQANLESAWFSGQSAASSLLGRLN